MVDMHNVLIKINPEITPDQLWDFYVRNDICEVGYGKEVAAKPLYNSSLIVGAFQGDMLVGIARAMFDGQAAAIMEFCVECTMQGESLEYENGSLVENDRFGIGKRIGEALVSELRDMGQPLYIVTL